MESLIIDRPNKLSLQCKYTDILVKIFLLLCWLLLGSPAITFVAWYVGYTFFDQHLILLEGYVEYKTPAFFTYLSIIAALPVIVLAWSKFNKILAKKIEGFEEDTNLSIADSSQYYQILVEDIVFYRTLKTMTVSITDQGKISGVR